MKSVKEQVLEQFRDQAKGRVWTQVPMEVLVQVWEQASRQVRDQIDGQVWAQVGDQVKDEINEIS